MASRSDSRQATEALHEIESVFDRTAEVVADNPRTVLSAIALILLSAAAAGLWTTHSRHRAEEAAQAVAEIQADFLAAMGAPAGAIVAPEPANPQIARDARKSHAARFLAAADRYDGTAAAVQARLQAGALLAAIGDGKGALAAWRAAATRAPHHSQLEALAWMRLAEGLDAQGDSKGAAKAWETAGNLKQPVAALALAQAARCWADAGDPTRALAVFGRAEARANAGDPIPDHLSARLRELRLRQQAAHPQ